MSDKLRSGTTIGGNMAWHTGNMGPGSGLNADKLDDIDSSQFLRSDATDIKNAGHLTFNDNIYLKFGTGGDAEIFHNGSNLYTDINNGGNWYLRDGNSGEATRFTFDIDAGNFTATGAMYANGGRVFSEGFRNISNSVTSRSTTIYASVAGVRAAYNLAASKMTQATADARYVNVTGDTMTGVLTVVRSTDGVGLALQTGSNSEIDISMKFGMTAATNAYYLKYYGSGSGNNNDFAIESSTKTLLRSHQDGIVNFPQLGTTIAGNKIWHAGNDGAGSGLDADKLDGKNSSSSSAANTVTLRDTAGDINARLFRSEYDATNANCAYFMTQVNTGTNNYIRPSTKAQVQAALKDGNLNADKLDGIDSSQFLRSDATDIKNAGHLTFNDNIYLKFGTGGDAEIFHNGRALYMDINNGHDWYIRDGNSSNATRFKFDVDAGNLTAAKFTGALAGNATTATKLKTTRNIKLEGDIDGSVNFDGGRNVVINTTLSEPAKLTARQHDIGKLKWGVNCFMTLVDGMLWTATAHVGGFSGACSGRHGNINPPNPGLQNTQVVPIPTSDAIVDYGTNGYNYAYALTDTGDLYMWGFGVYGTIPNNPATDCPVLAATSVDGVYTCYKASGAGYNWAPVFYAKGGNLWGGGYNSQGNLGVGNTTNAAAGGASRKCLRENGSSLQFDPATDKIWVTANDSNINVINQDGKMLVVGRNSTKASGLATPTYIDKWTDVTSIWNPSGGAMTITHVVGGSSAEDETWLIVAFFDASGTFHLKSCGQNNRGQCGRANTTAISTPVDVIALTGSGKLASLFPTGIDDLVDFLAGSHWLVAKNGDMYGWGRNAVGALGVGNEAVSSRPKLITTNVDKILCGPVVTPSYEHSGQSSLVKRDGSLWMAGHSDANCYIPQVSDAQSTLVRVNMPGDLKIEDLGGYTTTGQARTYVAKLSDGKLYGWGYGGQYAFMQGNTVANRTPIEIKFYK